TVRRYSGGVYRVFFVAPSANVDLFGLTIAGGSTGNYPGGGVFNDGRLLVSHCTFTDNSAVSGAGIYSDGDLAVANSTFFDNHAVGGGAIDSQGLLTVTNSTFSGNTAFEGGALQIEWGTATVINTTITDNRLDGPPYKGGGIWVSPEASLTLHNSVVAGNEYLLGDISGAVEPSSSNNLIGIGADMTGIADHDANHNRVGTEAAPIDPLP